MFTTKEFWLATAERAGKTFAQALAALLIASGTDLLHTSWVDSLSTAGMAAVLSVLTSVAGAGVGSNGPSLGPETTKPDTPSV